MGKFTHMDKQRMVRDKARRDAPYREMESVSKDKNLSDDALINNYQKCATLALKRQHLSRAIAYYEILAGYFREYNMHSRLLHTQRVIADLEHRNKKCVRGRLNQKKTE
mgnify:CR=1 FL=1|jgi:hypothetical protein